MKKLLMLAVLFASSCSSDDDKVRENTGGVSGISIEINFGTTDFVSTFLTGITHTQNGIDPWDYPKAVTDAKILLENSTYFQNQHIMG